MPRQPRIDIPGLLHHVIFRGIEGCPIVQDDVDRLGFVARLGHLAEECRTPVYAWALLDNHAHILLRSSNYGLSRFMRRLLTGHAITFNLRYKRQGHLFQNRYKSIICEEENYFLELIRYIHLNPIRAGQVENLEALKTYPWCGHATLMAARSACWQYRDEVLAYFGRKEKPAIAHYEQFLNDGLGQGTRPDLMGGGLRRSQANSGTSKIEPAAYDERILGSGNFVEQIMAQNDTLEPLLNPQEIRRQGQEFLQRICDEYSITPQLLGSGSRRHPVSEARAVIAQELIRNLGWSTTAVAKLLGVSTSAISKIFTKV